MAVFCYLIHLLFVEGLQFIIFTAYANTLEQHEYITNCLYIVLRCSRQKVKTQMSAYVFAVRHTIQVLLPCTFCYALRYKNFSREIKYTLKTCNILFPVFLLTLVKHSRSCQGLKSEMLYPKI